MAAAWNWYAVPLVRPGTVTGLVAAVPVKLPGVDLTMYPVMGSPPVAPGVTPTWTWPLPGVRDAMEGAPGTVAPELGTMALDSADGRLAPSALIATTEN